MRLSTSWENGPALILFWRHFGCSCALERAARLKAEYSQYLKAGVSAVVIGQAEPGRSTVYREHNGLECPVLSEPERIAYSAFDVLKGTATQILFDASDALLRCEVTAGEELAASRHGTERASVDSPRQLPGEFVIGSDGTVHLAYRYQYRYQYCEDWPHRHVLTTAIRFGGAPA